MLSPVSVNQTHPGKIPLVMLGLQDPKILFISVLPFQLNLCSGTEKKSVRRPGRWTEGPTFIGAPSRDLISHGDL